MGKAEFGTPKYIANKIKAKGLQKLRWYCQMCQKQCRDENGFKCHTMSESHQRQLLLFAENPHRYLDSFSREFEQTYLHSLKMRYGTKRVNANQVYQEYISDRHHLHMNATKWETLTDFVKHLGRVGKCEVDQTEKGWFVQYIDRDPETIAMQEKHAKKEKMAKDDEERLKDFIEKQVERGKNVANSEDGPSYTELQREGEEKVNLNLNLSQAKSTGIGEKRPSLENPLMKTSKSSTVKEKGKDECQPPEKRKKKSALEELMAEEERIKEKSNRKDYWLTEGIVVKVMAKSLGDKYYKEKGVVKEVINRYVAIVEMIKSGHRLKLDQAHVETVIPALGRVVMVVNGAYRGNLATLVTINEQNFSATIEISSGLQKGRKIENVQYEDICKVHYPS
ncbi:unnamed protein product [Darwinula stevensoni]|uniref:DNA/RNA-binding protein Kin17 WH-like domain-containing protein n=1 Tax=Darwinula stevensoni TaxID=69355 RepID=A0A7R8X1D1_9CRUS|nr:unnamed protein product [Darwinula stevensoni]CAG0882673.1 unnamed protein product [Darwinula stevensoni]